MNQIKTPNEKILCMFLSRSRRGARDLANSSAESTSCQISIIAKFLEKSNFAIYCYK